MAKQKAKFYVVWQGREAGIYDSWAACEAQVKGVAAKYKGFATREEAESFMTKLKELAAAASSADEGASVAYKIKDLEGQVELDAAFTFSCQAEMIIFELSLRSLA